MPLFLAEELAYAPVEKSLARSIIDQCSQWAYMLRLALSMSPISRSEVCNGITRIRESGQRHYPCWFKVIGFYSICVCGSAISGFSSVAILRSHSGASVLCDTEPGTMKR